MKRRQFISTTSGAGLSLVFLPERVAANPLIWAAVRTVIWPAVRALGGMIVRGAAAYAREWVAEKAIDLALEGTLKTLKPGSNVYKIGMRANRIRRIAGHIEGVIDVVEAVKIILEADDDDGAPYTIWSDRDESAPEDQFGTQYLTMHSLHLQLIHQTHPDLLADLGVKRNDDPEHMAADKSFSQALLVPVSRIKHEAVSVRRGVNEADMLTYRSSAATVSMLIFDKKEDGNKISFRYVMKLEQLGKEGERPRLIWGTPLEGKVFTLPV